jgi:serine/threonine-protein kinase
MSIGTVGYMAPEQSLGGTDVDSRADIYSLGVVAHEMFAGTPPFVGANTHSILAAHLTQAPPRLDKLRRDVPVPICRAIEKALKKEPADRFQTATEFSAAMAPGSGSRAGSRAVRVPRLPISRLPLAKLGMAGMVLAVGVGGWYAYNRDPRGETEGISIVIAPFDASSGDLGIWHEGMVDVLARNLDAGVLTTVSPAVSIKNWGSGRRSEKNAAVDLGRQTNAQYAIYGSLVPAIGDSVRAHLGLVHVQTDSVVLEQDLLDNDVTRLANNLSVRVVRKLNELHQLGAVGRASIGSNSATALRAFLQGEQHYRRTSWDSAATAYASAIEADTGFALALRRAGLVRAWRVSESDSAARAFFLRAGARNQGLAARDSLLIAADSLSAALETIAGEAPDWGMARRLFATVAEAATRYPDDPEVWYRVGEARFHHGYGSIFDLTEAEVRDAFNRAVARDSAFAPAYIHLVELGFTLEGATAGRGAAREYLARNPEGVHAEGIRLLYAATDPEGSDPGEVQALMDKANSEALLDAWFLIRRWPDSAETALGFLRALARRPRTSPGFARDSVQLSIYLPNQLAYRGRFREAYITLGDRPSRLFSQLALLGAVDTATAARVFSTWLGSPDTRPHLALPWWTDRGDTASIIALVRKYDADAARARADGKPASGYEARAARAYLMLAKKDTGAARNAFSELSDSLCLRCDFDHLTAARLLKVDRRYGAADKILRQRLYTVLTPTEVVMALERGKVAQADGKDDVARRAFELVIRAWGRGDPELQPIVRDAQESIRRLGR